MQNSLKQLLVELDRTYQGSQIFRAASAENKSWSYSLVDGYCSTNQPLLIGFNWGAGKNISYKPQNLDDDKAFAPPDLGGSMSRVRQYLATHFPNHQIENMNQTNYCFFRSETESQIDESDLVRCQPIFKKLIDLLKPSVVICFSSKLRDYLLSAKLVSIEDSDKLTINFNRGRLKSTYTVMKGRFESGVVVNFLPHPNYPMTRDARVMAWEFCF